MRCRRRSSEHGAGARPTAASPRSARGCTGSRPTPVSGSSSVGLVAWFRTRRALPPSSGPVRVPASDLPWLQPYPDLLIDESPEPDDAVVTRETIELAFLAAIQHLPPRQRAVLILRDVLDWPADDTALVLDMSLAAANSALQRARATMQERLPARRLEWATAADAEEAERSLLQTYVEAFERHDDRQLVALLREDVRLAMPPSPTWYEGREAVAAFLADIAFAPGSEAHRFVPTRANRQPAFGVYRGEGADARPFAINVLEISPASCHDMHFFKLPELFPALRAPRHARMTANESECDALFRDPFPTVSPGASSGLQPGWSSAWSCVACQTRSLSSRRVSSSSSAGRGRVGASAPAR